MSISAVSSNLTKSSNAIELYQGESKDLSLFVCQDVEQADGTFVEEPVDLTGATLTMTVRTMAGSPDVLISKSSSNALEIEILSPEEDGEALIHIDSVDTETMAAGEYRFDIWVLLSSGKRVPVVEVSEFIVNEPITKP